MNCAKISVAGRWKKNGRTYWQPLKIIDAAEGLIEMPKGVAPEIVEIELHIQVGDIVRVHPK